MTRRKSQPARALPDIGAGTLSPAEMSGRALPRAPRIDAHLPFEKRAEWAWRKINVARCASDEYGQLQEVLVAAIELDFLKEETE